MQITAEEIDLVEEIGTLSGSPVKMVRTKGGFWIAISRLKGKLKEEAIAAGSHPAIVKFNIERQYPEFQHSMMKSETMADPTEVENHSHFLSEELRKSGHDIYSLQKGNVIEFYITKQNIRVSTVQTTIEDGSIVVSKLDIPQQFIKGMAGAVTEKAVSCKASKLKMGAK